MTGINSTTASMTTAPQRRPPRVRHPDYRREMYGYGLTAHSANDVDEEGEFENFVADPPQSEEPRAGLTRRRRMRAT